MTRRLATDKELHEIFPILSLWSINDLRRKGKIPYLKIPGVKRYFYDVDIIEKWFDELCIKAEQSNNEN